MGISTEHILLYGWRHDDILDWDFEKYEPYEATYMDDPTGEVVTVTDGMGGDYALVGLCLFISEDRRWGQADIPLMQVEDPPMDQQQKMYKVVYRDMGIEFDREPGHFVLSHHH